MRVQTIVADAWRSRDGGIALVFAMAVGFLFASVGVAVDFSLSYSKRSLLQSAADAAALTAVMQASESDGSSANIERAKDAARAIYDQQLRGESAELRGRPTVELTQEDGAYTARVSFGVDHKTVFGAFLGSQTASLGGVAIASMSKGSFVDLYLALDVSDSMGLGGSTAEQQRMLSYAGCQFGCHVSEPGMKSAAQAAIDIGVRMRIDVMKSAATSLISQIEALPTASSFRAGVVTFHDQAQEVLAPTSRLADVRASISSLTLAMGRPRASTNNALGLVPDAGDTQPMSLVRLLESRMTSQGTGSDSDPRKLVVLVTDGTVSTWSPGLSTAPWDPATCNELKSRGIEIAVIYLEYTYFGKDTDSTYSWAIRPIEDQILPNLKACSTGLFVKANEPAEVLAAFGEIAKKAAKLTSVRLTR